MKINPLGAISAALTRLQSRAYSVSPVTRQLSSSSPSSSSSAPYRPSIQADVNFQFGTAPGQQAWPAPLVPVRQIGPQDPSPLVFPITDGQNLNYTPRADAKYSSTDLKLLASYPLARICIQNIKDYVSRTPWAIQLKQQPGETASQRDKRGLGDENLIKLSKFFEYPDGYLDWSLWVRRLVEDELVMDAPSVLVCRDTLDTDTWGRRRGRVTRLETTEGDQIARYVDYRGRIPHAPAPAYAQLWQGIPRLEFTTEDLVYRPCNIVPRDSQASYLYGMSASEMMAEEIKSGALRLASVLAYYEKGSVPGILHVVPGDAKPEDIIKVFNSINTRLSGQLHKLRQIQWHQGFYGTQDTGQDQIIQTKDPLLADGWDEMHIRRICFGYGVSPQRMVKSLNRASGEMAQESAEEEGSEVWLDWAADFMNYIIQRVMGYRDCMMSFQPKKDTDPLRRAQTTQLEVEHFQATINEARIRDGREPDPSPRANRLGCMTAQGFVTLDEMDQGLLKPQLPLSSTGIESNNKGDQSGDKGAKEKGAGDQEAATDRELRSRPAVPAKESPDKNKTAKSSSKSYKLTVLSPASQSTGLFKYSQSQPRDNHGRWTDTGNGGQAGTAVHQGISQSFNHTPQSQSLSTRALKARLSHKPSTRAKQIIADHAEEHLSKVLGIPRSGDNAPFDLRDDRYGIEIKSITDNAHFKLTVHPDSLVRKKQEAEQANLETYTIAIDKRGTEDTYYIRKGLGSFRIRHMDRLTSPEALKAYIKAGSR